MILLVSYTSSFFLMEPEPSIQRAFSFVAQEVEQRVTTVPTTANVINASAMMLRGSSNDSSRVQGGSYKRKERPLCTHCGSQGHTIDRRYKLHGFTP